MFADETHSFELFSAYMPYMVLKFLILCYIIKFYTGNQRLET